MYKKTYQFKLSVQDEKYDSSKTANVQVSGREILPRGRFSAPDFVGGPLELCVKVSSLTVQAFVECINSAGNWAFGFQNFGFLIGFEPEI
jgi:hypothetical protein